MSFRLKRLYADYMKASQIFSENPYISIKSATGNPPERYKIEYNIKGLEQQGDKIKGKKCHLAEIVLTRNYPTEKPLCRMLTPVFHPNIDHIAICIADPGQWTAGESLTDLIVRIGKIICYQSYNIKSPRNGEAAKWAEKNIHRFPIDNVNLNLEKRPEEIIVGNTEVERGIKASLEKKENIEDRKENMEVSIESKKQITVETCSNCGNKGDGIQFQECVNGHVVCSDCTIECQDCEKNLCVLCSFNKCPICEKLICTDCQSSCSSCEQIICKKHIVECNICQNEVCSKCTLVCSECQKNYCKAHFNEREERCTQCAPEEDKIKITYEDLERL